MKKILVALCAASVALGLSVPASAAADPTGTYTRKNGDTVRVWVTEGKLYCRITEGKKKNFEMCHGMTDSGEAWTGKKMKHPGMPGFMSFNGTVTSDASSIKIKGCAMGMSMCDAEVSTRVK